MKRFFLFILICVGNFQFVDAQLLWKITASGVDKPSYLLGTHYLVPMVYLDSVKGLANAFNECDAVVSEVIANNIDASTLLRKVAFIQGGQTLKVLISEEDYPLADKALKSELKIGLKELSKMYPTFILRLYEIELFKKLTGIYDDAQTDSYFQLAALQKDKKIIALETVEQQVQLSLDQNDLQRHANQLTKALLNRDSLSNELIKIGKLYKGGNINDFALLAKIRTQADVALNGISTIEMRNSEWLKKLPDYIKAQSCFITVNIEHLAGENGLINGLKQAGYKVKAVE